MIIKYFIIYMQNKDHYMYEIEYFHPWYDYINTYLGEFSNLKFLRITDMKLGKPVYGLPYGKVEYEFNDSTIYVNLEKDGDINIVKTQKWYDLKL